MRAFSTWNSRRELLRGAAAFAASLAAPSPWLSSQARAAPGTPPFGKVLDTPDFTLPGRYVACARPHRTGGIRLKQAMLTTTSGEKFLIHNYGHSGAGITLGFGCASVVADKVAKILLQLQGTNVRPMVAVLGCGVIGLTVAAELRRRWPKLYLVIYSSHKETELTDITSFKAGGQFEPTGVVDEYLQHGGMDELHKYVTLSHSRILQFPARQRALYGIERRYNYTLREGSKGFDEGVPKNIIPAPQEGPLPFARLTERGKAYYTWLINPTILLPRLVADLKAQGAAFRQRTFKPDEDWSTMRENILLNCTGLGAGELFGGDTNVKPIRGQLIILPNPKKLNYFFSGGCDGVAYMFARQNDIVVGGTWERGTAENGHGRCEPGIGHHDKCDEFLHRVIRVFNGDTDACHSPAVG